MKKFAERLKELRLEKDRLIGDVAKELGVTLTTVARWEKGTREPDNIDMLIKICVLFNCSAGYLIGLED